MATRMELPPFARFTVPCRIPPCLVFLFLLTIFLTVISQASAQTAQQYVYLSLPGSPLAGPTSQISGFSKAGQTSALSSVPGSPFSDRLEGGLVAIDGQGKFLFVLNPTSNDISMFQIDQVSGALSEVPGSRFAVPAISGNAAPTRLTRRSGLALGGIFSAAIFCIALSFAGCGGGSAAVAPPRLLRRSSPLPALRRSRSRPAPRLPPASCSNSNPSSSPSPSNSISNRVVREARLELLRRAIDFLENR